MERRMMKHPILRISRGLFGALTLFLLCFGAEYPRASAQALNRAPVPVPESLLPVIRKTFDSGEPHEQGAASRFATRAKLAELHGAAMQVFEKSTDRTLNDAANAVAVLGTPGEYVAALVDRLADSRVRFQILGLLENLFDGTSGHSGSTAISAPATLALSRRWKTFVAQHRADIESGRKISSRGVGSWSRPGLIFRDKCPHSSSFRIILGIIPIPDCYNPFARVFRMRDRN